MKNLQRSRRNHLFSLNNFCTRIPHFTILLPYEHASTSENQMHNNIPHSFILWEVSLGHRANTCMNGGTATDHFPSMKLKTMIQKEATRITLVNSRVNSSETSSVIFAGITLGSSHWHHEERMRQKSIAKKIGQNLQ